jgi:hypothetical protein
VTDFYEWAREILGQRLMKQSIFEEDYDSGGVFRLHELDEDILDNGAVNE